MIKGEVFTWVSNPGMAASQLQESAENYAWVSVINTKTVTFVDFILQKSGVEIRWNYEPITMLTAGSDNSSDNCRSCTSHHIRSWGQVMPRIQHASLSFCSVKNCPPVQRGFYFTKSTRMFNRLRCHKNTPNGVTVPGAQNCSSCAPVKKPMSGSYFQSVLLGHFAA